MNNTFGEPIQILQLNPNGKYELNTRAIEQIFLSENLNHVNLSVVSIAGAFRKGKSFLLSFFLRYLSVFYSNNDASNKTDWLGEESSRLTGFAWRGGSERHTTGIWIWSKIFTKTMPNGEEIGIVLLDTQGTFDNNSSMHNNVTIFALSTMLSSIQIFNVFNNVQEDDLQHLQLFTEYGRIAIENTENDYKPFQQLMFLIRDWSFPYEYPYGLFGGLKKLEKILEVKETGQSTENQAVRKHLKLCFNEIACYLMPSPGECTRISQEFDGRLSHVSPEFQQHLKRLVPYLLKPTNIEKNGLKMINGVSVKPKVFYNLIHQYWNVFKRGTMPEARSILTATAESVCLSAKNDASQMYFGLIKFHAESHDIETPQLLNIHKNISDEAIKMYNAKAIIGDEEIRNRYRQELKSFLQDNVLYYVGLNQSQRTKSLQETVLQMRQEIESLKARCDPSDLITALQMQLEIFQIENQELHAERIKEMEKNVLDSLKGGQQQQQAVVRHSQKHDWCSIS